MLKARKLAAVVLTLGLVILSAGCGGARPSAASGSADQPLTRANSPDSRLALTFDVTWGKDELAKILAALQAGEVKATFFVGGTFLTLNGDLVRQMAAAGHEVGTLGQKIVDLSGLSEQEVITNLLASQSNLTKAVGGPARYFRPPQGPATPEVVRAARAANLITVTQSLDSEDHIIRRADRIVKRVVSRAGRGDIIRLSASDWSPETAKALPGIITRLREKGFKLVTISELVPPEQ